MNAGGLVVLWIFIVIAGVKLVSAMARDQRFRQEDFAVYYFAAQATRQHRNPYTTNIAKMARTDDANTHDISRTSDPPTFLLLFAPLSTLPLQYAYWAWQAINFGCLAAALFLLMSMNWKVEPMLAAAIAGLALLYPPVGVHFWMGQSKLPVLLLLVLMMRWIANRREAAAGLALALATLLRVFPLALIGYFVLRRRWRIAAHTIVGLLTGIVITVMFVGLTNTESFIQSLSFLTGHWWEHDISLRCFVANTIWAIYPHPVFTAKITIYAITAMVDLAVVIMTVRATLMFENRDDPNWRIFSLWVATSVFLLPVTWDYDLTLMLIPFVQLACGAARGQVSRRALLMAVVSYVLMLIWEGLISHVLPPGSIGEMTMSESGFLSMATGYLAAYWFAVDAPGAQACALRELPARLAAACAPRASCGLRDLSSTAARLPGFRRL